VKAYLFLHSLTLSVMKLKRLDKHAYERRHNKVGKESYKGSVDSSDGGDGGSHGSVVFGDVERKGKVVVQLQIQC